MYSELYFIFFKRVRSIYFKLGSFCLIRFEFCKNDFFLNIFVFSTLRNFELSNIFLEESLYVHLGIRPSRKLIRGSCIFGLYSKFAFKKHISLKIYNTNSRTLRKP